MCCRGCADHPWSEPPCWARDSRWWAGTAWWCAHRAASHCAPGPARGSCQARSSRQPTRTCNSDANIIADSSVADPHWFQCISGSSIFCQCGFGSESRSKVLMTKNWKKFTAEIKFIYFGSKIVIRLCLDLHKGRPSYRRSLHPSKANIWHFKTWIFFTIMGHFGPPGSGSGTLSSRPKWMRIRIRNTGWKFIVQLGENLYKKQQENFVFEKTNIFLVGKFLQRKYRTC